MQHLPYAAGCILRKVVLLTVIGFLVVFLSGPLIGLVAALLPFLIVGFLVWVVLRVLILGPVVVGRLIGNVVRAVFQVVLAVPRWVGRRVGSGIRRVGWTSRRVTGFVGGIFWETLYGAAVGAILGLMGGIQHQDVLYRVPVGAVIGAFIGALAGAVRSKPGQDIPTVIPVNDGCRHC